MKFSVVTLLFVFADAFAAIPNKQESVLTALRLSPPQRLQIIRQQGKEGIRQVREIAFNQKLPIESRWKALTTLVHIAGKESLPDLERALESSDWFMRDVGLKSLETVDATHAKQWARRLTSDPALVVRTSAVGVIKRLNDSSAVPLLWEKLYSLQNYRGAQSLWVRRHIVETLSTFAQKGDEEKFKKILTDKDTSLHKPALAALNRLSSI